MAPALMAAAHHVLAFLLVAVLAVQLTLVRQGMTPRDAALAARVDILYGAIFVALLAVGVARLPLEKGIASYATNLLFAAKMAALLGAAIVSIGPTRTFLRWRKAAGAPDPAEIGRVRAAMHLEAALLIAVPVLAALMARGYGAPG